MLAKSFVIFLSLQCSLTKEIVETPRRFKYHREFLSKVEPIENMEPFFIAEGERQAGCRPPITCNANYPYRTIPGVCNNLQNPYWGSAFSTFLRRLPPVFANGVDSFRGDGPGDNLPRARDVSYAMHTATDPTAASNDGITLLVMQWGQFIDHDLVFTPDVEVEHCCSDFKTIGTNNPECRPIDVTGDPFYSQFGVTCLEFLRSVPVDPSCTNGVTRENFNELTSYVDGSQVYGSTIELNQELRDNNDNAFLKIFSQNEDTCSYICPLNLLPVRKNAEGEDEFFGGDSRVEEQPGLTSMHTMLMRFHNDIANEFRKYYGNSVTSDFIFEEVRRIVSAVIQQITYNEFLPIVIGRQETLERGINIVQGPSYDSRYDPTIDATAPNVFATAVYRFGHSLIPDIYPLENIRVFLAESFFRHTRTITRGTFPSNFIRAIARTLAQKFDHIMVDAIVNKLFAEAPFDFGSDLMSRNIMRGREHGIPGYNAWRAYAGLSTFTSFDQLYGTMAKSVVDIFKFYYKSVDDIDLFPALISEYSDGNSLVGPLLRELIGEQFQVHKFGDRFWFENSNQPKPFTSNQLASIHRTKISSLICAYTNAQSVQRDAMHAVSDNNPLVPCSEILKVGVLNDITLYWL